MNKPSRLFLLSGPCVIESEALCLKIAKSLKRTCAALGITYVFKASFDKANRTSVKAKRGPGLDAGLRILASVRDKAGVPVLTDVHTGQQAEQAAKVVDILQIPAFLCRQTDLITAAANTGKIVNIKKGQFMAPEDMRFAVEKVTSTGNESVFVSERGAFFGYRDLVLDLRSLVTMRSIGYPVVFDATHSVQQMGAAGGSSGGRPAFIPAQVRAAVAVGIDALFIETHPDPEHALSDGSNMVPLERMRTLLQMALEVHSTHRAYVQ